MLATTTSNTSSTLDSDSVDTDQFASTPFARAFSMETRTDAGLMSMPCAVEDPIFNAAMPRIPLPHPTSSTETSASGIFSIKHKQPRVVG